MTDHKTGTREQWLAARLELLEAEKALTRRSDELARRRQELPWVRIDKEYRFETDEGTASLADLFGGRSQLLVYHFMFGPEYTAGCPSCSAIADGFDGSVVHLANHDVTLCAVSRAPLRETAGVQAADGLELPLGVFVRQRLQLRLPGDTHQRAVAVGSRRVQLPQDGLSAAGRRGESRGRRARVERRNGLGDVQARRARHERVHARRMASYTTPTRPTNAGSTASGACTSGSTARHSAATRPASGGAATTSTTASDTCGTLRHRPHRCVRRPARGRSPRGDPAGQPHQCHNRSRKPCRTTKARNGSAATADGNRIPAGRTAVVVGASRGLGRGIARAFSEASAPVGHHVKAVVLVVAVRILRAGPTSPHPRDHVTILVPDGWSMPAPSQERQSRASAPWLRMRVDLSADPEDRLDGDSRRRTRGASAHADFLPA